MDAKTAEKELTAIAEAQQGDTLQYLFTADLIRWVCTRIEKGEKPDVIDAWYKQNERFRTDIANAKHRADEAEKVKNGLATDKEILIASQKKADETAAVYQKLATERYYTIVELARHIRAAEKIVSRTVLFEWATGGEKVLLADLKPAIQSLRFASDIVDQLVS